MSLGFLVRCAFKQRPCETGFCSTWKEVSELPNAQVTIKFQLSPLDFLTIIISTADHGCVITPLSVPGPRAPGLPPADQIVSAGVRPAMPHHDGAGL